jgi:hypothetical protein
MRTRDFALFLGLEAFAVLWAGLVFSLVPAKLLAGALAGSYFLGFGFYMLIKMHTWEGKNTSPTWYLLFVHIFAISIPMLISRFAQAALGFDDVKILGIPGPIFHKISSGVFVALVAATVIDLIRSVRAKKRDAV